jgi:hypothetical protein
VESLRIFLPLGKDWSALAVPEKFQIRDAANRGAIENIAFAVCLKAYPDTKRVAFSKVLLI